MTSIATDDQMMPTSDVGQQGNPYEEWSEQRALLELLRGLKGDFNTSGSLAVANDVDLSKMTDSEKLIYRILHQLPSSDSFVQLERDCLRDLNLAHAELSQHQGSIRSARGARYALDKWTQAVILDPIGQPEHEEWCKSVDDLYDYMAELCHEHGNFETKLPRPKRYAPTNRKVKKYCREHIGELDEDDQSYDNGDFEPLLEKLIDKAMRDDDWQTKLEASEARVKQLEEDNRTLRGDMELTKHDRHEFVEELLNKNKYLEGQVQTIQSQRDLDIASSQTAEGDESMADEPEDTQPPTQADYDAVREESLHYQRLFEDQRLELEEAVASADGGISIAEYQALQSKADKLTKERNDKTAEIDQKEHMLSRMTQSWFALCKSLLRISIGDSEDSITSVECLLQGKAPVFAISGDFDITTRSIKPQWAPLGYFHASENYPTSLTKSELIRVFMGASDLSPFQFLAWVDETFLSVPQTLDDSALLVLAIVYDFCTHDDWYTRSLALTCFSTLCTKYVLKDSDQDLEMKHHLVESQTQLTADWIAQACFLRIGTPVPDQYEALFEPHVATLKDSSVIRTNPIVDIVDVIASGSQNGRYLRVVVGQFQIGLVHLGEGQEVMWVNDSDSGWQCSAPGFRFEFTIVTQPDTLQISWNERGGSMVVNLGGGGEVARYFLAHHGAAIDSARALAQAVPGRWYRQLFNWRG